ncbi:MAG: hypothetical protein KGO50_12910 [Myxococcales bacterium]|nr:hypothetical protein [Myxococcales bacterium]
MSIIRQLALRSFAVAAVAMAACSDEGADDDGQGGGSSDAGADAGDSFLADAADGSATPALSPLGQAAIDIGLAAFLGELPAPTLETSDADTQTWAWGVDDGPLCMRGGSFRYTTRALDPERLVVFLQGGGACWDEFCLAVNQAPAGIPAVDALRRDLDVNPLRDWSIAYLPYCDGSLFAGNRDHDDDGDGTPDRFHRGLLNLSAALQHSREQFPAPRQVLLTGSSAGGFGTILATALVRVAWPQAEVLVFNDSGVGVARDGDVRFISHLIDQFGASQLVPDDCQDCLVNGHISPLIGWALERDENLRVAIFSSWFDSIIGDTFLGMDPYLFQQALARETGDLHERFPERYRRFIVDDSTHTTLLGDPTGIIGTDLSAIELPDGFLSNLGAIRIGSLVDTRIGDVTTAMWLQAFVDGDAAWTDIVEEPTVSPWLPEE